MRLQVFVADVIWESAQSGDEAPSVSRLHFELVFTQPGA